MRNPRSTHKTGYRTRIYGIATDRIQNSNPKRRNKKSPGGAAPLGPSAPLGSATLTTAQGPGSLIVYFWLNCAEGAVKKLVF
jgi:hypothetical protein